MVTTIIAYSNHLLVTLTLGGDLVHYIIDHINMGKIFTAGAMKGISQHNKRDLPREGSKIRELYDLFMANKGKIIAISLNLNGDTSSNRRKEYLQDSYGLDIRKVCNGKWILAGEWDGKVYIDYMANKSIT